MYNKSKKKKVSFIDILQYVALGLIVVWAIEIAVMVL